MTETKTDMCYEGIDRFHYIWNDNWCPEMTEEQIIKAYYDIQEYVQTIPIQSYWNERREWN